MPKIALLFAGQGAQTVGMGAGLIDLHPEVRGLFDQADRLLGEPPLSQIMFEGPEETLTRTRYCQPALYLHGLACLRLLQEMSGGFPFEATAGLSLGEFTAHAAAGSFDFTTGLKLVSQRGIFMDEACAATVGAMVVMIGGAEDQIRELAAQTDVDVANLNCPGQIVLSGESTKIALAASLAREFGVRMAKTLNVAGAYHSRLMESAAQKLVGELEGATIVAPKVPVICNVDARVVNNPDDIRSALADQVTGSVLWESSMELLLSQGHDLFIEFGPGAVLAGLMGRIDKSVEVLSVFDQPTLEKAAARLKQ